MMSALALYLCVLSIFSMLLSVTSTLNMVTPENVTTTVFLPAETETTTVRTYTNLKSWDLDVHCKFQANQLECNPSAISIKRWYYDIKLENCKQFEYNRCRSSNKNNFKTEIECFQACRDAGPQDIMDVLPENAACMLQPDFGDCQDYIPMFYFDISSRRCLGFAFSGCGGNQNRFHDTKTCQGVCVDATSELIIQPLDTNNATKLEDESHE